MHGGEHQCTSCCCCCCCCCLQRRMRRQNQHHQHVRSPPEQAHRSPHHRCRLGKAAVGLLGALFFVYGAVFIWEEGTFRLLRNNSSNFYGISSTEEEEEEENSHILSLSEAPAAAAPPAAEAPAVPAPLLDGNNRTSLLEEGGIVLPNKHRHPHEAGNTTTR